MAYYEDITRAKRVWNKSSYRTRCDRVVMPLPGSRRRHTRVVGTVFQRHQKKR